MLYPWQSIARYLNKKKEAEEITQEYEAKPSADYSLKEGETLRLQLKNVSAFKHVVHVEVFHIYYHVCFIILVMFVSLVFTVSWQFCRGSDEDIWKRIEIQVVGKDSEWLGSKRTNAKPWHTRKLSKAFRGSLHCASSSSASASTPSFSASQDSINGQAECTCVWVCCNRK
jgi:hypothetical protein